MSARFAPKRADELPEIFTAMPRWIVRWGILVLFSIFGLLMGAAWFIRYPAVVPARIMVTSKKPPVRLVARESGALRLLVRDKEFIRAGRWLAAISTSASLEDVQELMRWLEAAESQADAGQSPVFGLRPAANLGELQEDHARLRLALQEYREFRARSRHAERVRAMAEQIEALERVVSHAARRHRLLEREVALAQSRYENARRLFDDRIVSQSDLSRAEEILLQAQRALEEGRGSAAGSQVQLSEYRKALLDLDQATEQELRSLRNAADESRERLVSRLTDWKRRYVFEAPVDGEVSLFRFWADNEHVTAGDEIMTVLPASNDLVGRIYLPSAGSGNVRTGQKVWIKFDDYPAHEFGAVEGRVVSVPVIARDGKYSVTVSLPAGLTTTYGKALDFKREMGGTAEIVTDDLRLAERFFQRLRATGAGRGG